jgi:hypothetical protein
MRRLRSGTLHVIAKAMSCTSCSSETSVDSQTQRSSPLTSWLKFDFYLASQNFPRTFSPISLTVNRARSREWRDFEKARFSLVVFASVTP